MAAGSPCGGTHDPLATCPRCAHIALEGAGTGLDVRIGVRPAQRAWHITSNAMDGSPSLRSLSHGYEWKPGINTAKCLNPAGPLAHAILQQPITEIPNAYCSCGFYGQKLLDGIYKRHPVWGEVELWGHVIEGEQGYRAQYASITKLYVKNTHWEHAATLAAKYGVPVEVAPEQDTSEIDDMVMQMRAQMMASLYPTQQSHASAAHTHTFTIPVLPVKRTSWKWTWIMGILYGVGIGLNASYALTPADIGWLRVLNGGATGFLISSAIIYGRRYR